MKRVYKEIQIIQLNNLPVGTVESIRVTIVTL